MELKGREQELLLQEKTDRLNQLSIQNEELDRTIQDKEESIIHLTTMVKNLEKNIELNMSDIKEKDEVLRINFQSSVLATLLLK